MDGRTAASEVAPADVMTRAARRRDLSLDMPVGDGRTLGDVVGCHPDVEVDDDHVDAGDDRMHRLRAVGAHAKAELLKRRFAQSAIETERLRRAADSARAAAESLERDLMSTARAAHFAGLSPAQLRIVHAQVTLAANGEPVTHHAVSRLLGLGPAGHANVSTQVRRIAQKLARAESVSTSAA